MPDLPSPRGPLSAALLETLRGDAATTSVDAPDVAVADPLADDDLHLALYLLYELHYRGLPGVDERWEWAPDLLAFRARLEAAFESALLDAVPFVDAPLDPSESDVTLRAVIAEDDAPSMSKHVAREATVEQLREYLVHRSGYQLKEADPHSWAIPRLDGPAKAALVEIQADEYGGGVHERVHSVLFADAMDALGLDARYGAYLDVLPGHTLATVNLISLFGLHRRLRAACVAHLAVVEMSSSVPMRRYGDGLRRLGFDSPAATAFFDEHVEADAVHQGVAAVDLAGGLVRAEPALAGQLVWGARCLNLVEGRWAREVLGAWERGESSLRAPLAMPATA